MLLKSVTREEIGFSVNIVSLHKAPGPDWLNAHFFKLCLLIVGKDICAIVMDFLKKFSKNVEIGENLFFLCLFLKGSMLALQISFG